LERSQILVEQTAIACLSGNYAGDVRLHKNVTPKATQNSNYYNVMSEKIKADSEYVVFPPQAVALRPELISSH